jgi:lipoprotein-anchoring transpeptidase ErfK/SrfK
LSARIAIGTTAVLIVAAAVALGVVMTRDKSTSTVTGPGAGSGTSVPGAATPSTAKVASVLIQPGNGSAGMPLNTIVAVTALNSKLTSVQVTTPDGKAVPGTLGGTSETWQSAAPLAPSLRYTVTVAAQSSTGQPIQQTSVFTTLAPKVILKPQIFPTEGVTVGVGMPIQIRFNTAVANKDAVIAAMHVTASTPVTGGWHWFSDKEAHFRPTVYWPAGDKVTITANLTGVDGGNGAWATANSTVNFVIGDSHISEANVATHVMTVTTNGQVEKTFPISAGSTKYPTMNGVHIALYRQQDVHMVSSTVGIPVDSADGYDEHVFWDVNISDGGEFVHAAPWSTGAQGRSNVSHGCVNLSVAAATWFFNYSHVGDVVSVVGSPRTASLVDHGTMDWGLPAAQWTPAT